AAAFHDMEMLRDPSHARGLTEDELVDLFRQVGLQVPQRAYWRMNIEVEGLMERSFPVPGSEATIRKMFADAVADDGMGLNTRRKGEQILFTYSNVILTAVR